MDLHESFEEIVELVQKGKLKEVDSDEENVFESLIEGFDVMTETVVL